MLACSALKRGYRDVLRTGASNLCFVHLAAPREVLVERLRHRAHFMPASLLDSQLQTLEPLGPDEIGFTLDASGDPEDVVARLSTDLSTGR